MSAALDQDPEILATYLLGDNDRYSQTEGLIRRVEKQLKALDTGYGPQFKTGSIQLVGVSGGDAEEPERIEEVFGLAVGLNEWLNGQDLGSSSSATQQALLKWLRKYDLSDVQYLVGWDSEDEGSSGKLAEVRGRLHDLMRPEPIPERNLARAVSLMQFLRGWLGECTHDFHEEESEAKNVHVFRCRNQFCDAGYMTFDGDPEWYRVGG